MSEMIERVARVLYRKNNPSSSDAKVDEHWHVLADTARWAIEAMRKPTGDMLAVVHDNVRTAASRWNSAIDQALK